MPVILKYTKAQYDAKITELQGYLNELKDHREKMVGLREQMYNFWDDPNNDNLVRVFLSKCFL